MIYKTIQRVFFCATIYTKEENRKSFSRLSHYERVSFNNGWTSMGGFIVCVVFILPIILTLVLFEVITLKKKNGYKTLELYSLFAMIFVWLICIPVYLYMI